MKPRRLHSETILSIDDDGGLRHRGSSLGSGYPPARSDADLRVPLRERPPVRGHAEDHGRPGDGMRDLRGAGPAGLPPHRGPLQGLRLLQHGLRHLQAQARGGDGQGERRQGRQEGGDGDGGDVRRQDSSGDSSSSSSRLDRSRTATDSGRPAARIRDGPDAVRHGARVPRRRARAGSPTTTRARRRAGRTPPSPSGASLAAAAQRARLGGAELARAVRRRGRHARSSRPIFYEEIARAGAPQMANTLGARRWAARP